MKRLLPPCIALLVLSLYTWAEFRGIASGGKERPPLSPSDLRQTSPGSWTYIYWSQDHHGK